jgi:hypothetical protein
MTSKGVFLKSAYKTPANFSDRRAGPPLRTSGAAENTVLLAVESFRPCLPVASETNNILRESARIVFRL